MKKTKMSLFETSHLNPQFKVKCGKVKAPTWQHLKRLLKLRVEKVGGFSFQYLIIRVADSALGMTEFLSSARFCTKSGPW